MIPGRGDIKPTGYNDLPRLVDVAIAKIMANITITANNSTNVNPFLFFMFLITLYDKYIICNKEKQ
jgi:hypothetical protein